MNALTQSTAAQPSLARSGNDLERARRLLQQTLEFVREQAQPWPGSGLANASDDPYVISRFGDLHIRIEVAAALHERADALRSNSQDPAEIAVVQAEAAIASADALLAASNAEFELTGQRSPQLGALQDPLRWKYQLIGNYRLNGVLPADLGGAH